MVRDPALRRALIAEAVTGGKTEVFTIPAGEGFDRVRLDVTAMRDWCSRQTEIATLPMDFERASDLAERGVVTSARLEEVVPMLPQLGPMIVCRYCPTESFGDTIVDGNHRYVAACMIGLKYGFDMPVPAHVLMPTEWSRFQLPENLTPENT